jgi:hypothetical protein
VRTAGRSTVVAAAFVTARFFDVLGAPVEFGQVSLSTGAEVVVGHRWLAEFLAAEPSATTVGQPCRSVVTPAPSPA